MGNSADLANILQDNYGAPEVANMKHGQLKVNVTIVADALSKSFTTRVTFRVLLTCTLQMELELEGRKS